MRLGLGTFFGLHANWTSDHAWTSLDEMIVGPKTVAFFASVKQTNPSGEGGRTVLTGLPSPFTFTEGLPPEEQFLQNFPGAQYWRVGGALVLELTYHGDFTSANGAPNAEAIR
jgi:hypothetical protein